MAKILIVDDAIFMRLMLKDILESEGHKVVGEASKGIKAIHLYKKIEPELVIIGATTPDINVNEVIREIKMLDNSAKIIMSSVVGQQNLIIDTLRAGAKDFVVKPYVCDKVVDVVDKFVA